MPPCPLCSSPVHSSALRSHLARHLDYAPWRCRLCPAAFLLHRHALRHSAEDHQGEAAGFVGDVREEMEERLSVLLSQAAEMADRAGLASFSSPHLPVKSEPARLETPPSSDSLPVPSSATKPPASSSSRSGIARLWSSLNAACAPGRKASEGRVAESRAQTSESRAPVPSSGEAGADRATKQPPRPVIKPTTTQASRSPGQSDAKPEAAGEGGSATAKAQASRSSDESEAKPEAADRAESGAREAEAEEPEAKALLRLPCGLCRVTISADPTYQRRHVLAKHMKTAMYVCKLCLYSTTKGATTATIDAHTASRHPRSTKPRRYRDLRREKAEAILRRVAEAFGPKPTAKPAPVPPKPFPSADWARSLAPPSVAKASQSSTTSTTFASLLRGASLPDLCPASRSTQLAQASAQLRTPPKAAQPRPRLSAAKPPPMPDTTPAKAQTPSKARALLTNTPSRPPHWPRLTPGKAPVGRPPLLTATPLDRPPLPLHTPLRGSAGRLTLVEAAKGHLRRTVGTPQGSPIGTSKARTFGTPLRRSVVQPLPCGSVKSRPSLGTPAKSSLKRVACDGCRSTFTPLGLKEHRRGGGCSEATRPAPKGPLEPSRPLLPQRRPSFPCSACGEEYADAGSLTAHGDRCEGPSKAKRPRVAWRDLEGGGQRAAEDAAKTKSLAELERRREEIRTALRDQLRVGAKRADDADPRLKRCDQAKPAQEEPKSRSSGDARAGLKWLRCEGCSFMSRQADVLRSHGRTPGACELQNKRVITLASSVSPACPNCGATKSGYALSGHLAAVPRCLRMARVAAPVLPLLEAQLRDARRMEHAMVD